MNPKKQMLNFLKQKMDPISNIACDKFTCKSSGAIDHLIKKPLTADAAVQIALQNYLPRNYRMLR